MQASLPGQIRVIMAIEELAIAEVLSVGWIHARCPLDTVRKIFNRMELVVYDYIATVVTSFCVPVELSGRFGRWTRSSNEGAEAFFYVVLFFERVCMLKNHVLRG